MKTESLETKSRRLIFTYHADINEDQDMKARMAEKLSDSLVPAVKKAVEKVFREEEVNVDSVTSLEQRGITIELFLHQDVYNRRIGKLVTGQQTKEIMTLAAEVQRRFCRKENL